MRIVSKEKFDAMVVKKHKLSNWSWRILLFRIVPMTKGTKQP
jgi:hypothetical protein